MAYCLYQYLNKVQFLLLFHFTRVKMKSGRKKKRDILHTGSRTLSLTAPPTPTLHGQVRRKTNIRGIPSPIPTLPEPSPSTRPLKRNRSLRGDYKGLRCHRIMTWKCSLVLGFVSHAQKL